MSERRPFYSKFVWKEWISDTLDMTPEEAGAYIRLLAYAATNSPDCSSLPDDENRLARAVGVSVKKWRGLAGAVLLKFDYGSTGWKSKRLRADFDKYAQLCVNQQKRRTAGAPEVAKTGTETSVRARASESELEVKTLARKSEKPFAESSGVATAREAQDEAQEPAAVKQPRARRNVPDRSIPPGWREHLAAKWSLPLTAVEQLADRMLLEFDARGYLVAKTALDRWCEREAKRTASAYPDVTKPTDVPTCPTCHVVLAEYANEPRCFSCGKELPRGLNR